jgi:hypothetical protein
VELPSGDDNVPKTNSLANKQKMTTDDDAESGGTSSAEEITPDPISSSVPGQAKPSAATQVDMVAPSTSGQKQKHPQPIPKRKPSKPSADQVMTQIELPPHCRLRSPLDLVTIEIIFGHLFEAF